MTKAETERLAIVETQVKDMQTDVTEIKSDIKDIKQAMISRKDIAIFSVVLGVLVALANYIIIVNR